LNHCKDCCCAESWKALGISEYTGKSIPEEIILLKEENEKLQRTPYNAELEAKNLELAYTIEELKNKVCIMSKSAGVEELAHTIYMLIPANYDGTDFKSAKLKCIEIAQAIHDSIIGEK